MKLVIDRSKWLRGEGTGNSYLLRESDGKQCCVGIFAETCGIDSKALARIKTASNLIARGRVDKFPPEMNWLIGDFGYDSQDAYALYGANDLFGDEEKREADIAAAFAKHGVEVEFVN